MSIRHVHARPGEYIAVHRGGTYHSARSNSSVNGAVFVIGFILLLCFWKPILTVIVAGFAIYFATKFLWLYRIQIWNGLRMLGGLLWNSSCSCYLRMRRWLANRKACRQIASQPQPQPTPVCLPPVRNSQHTYQSSATYGKIIQRH